MVKCPNKLENLQNKIFKSLKMVFHDSDVILISPLVYFYKHYGPIAESGNVAQCIIA